MSFVERELDLANKNKMISSSLSIDDEINIMRRMGHIPEMTNESVVLEVREIKKRLEFQLERINLIESFLGIQSECQKTKKKSNKNLGSNKEVLNIILIQKDDDVPDNCESILLVTDENYADYVIIETNDLKSLCRNVLLQPLGNNIDFPDIKSTNKYAILNESGEWEIKQRDVPNQEQDGDESALE